MSILEYADAVQRESLRRLPLAWGDEEDNSPPGPLAPSRARRILDEMAIPPSQRENHVWLAEQVLKDVRNHIDAAGKQVLESTPVVELLMADLNAHAVRDPASGETLILYGTHTEAILFMLNLLIAPDDVFPATWGNSERERFSGEALQVAIRWARAASRTLAYTYREDFGMPNALAGYVKRMRPLIHAQCMFILAHEIGHHVLGHLDGAGLSVADVAPDSAMKVNYLTHAQKQELEADGYACRMLQSLTKTFPEDWRDLGTFAADTLFTWFQLVEALAPEHAQDRPPTHPDASARRCNVRELMPMGSERRQADQAEKLVSMVYEKIAEQKDRA